MKNNQIYAVDFDGTLSLGEWPATGAPNRELFAFLKEKQKIGDKIILWTCRENESLTEAVKFCKENGLVPDAINDNLPEIVEKYGSNSRKVSCDYYIDDKALAFSLMGGNVVPYENRFAHAEGAV